MTPAYEALPKGTPSEACNKIKLLKYPVPRPSFLGHEWTVPCGMPECEIEYGPPVH